MNDAEQNANTHDGGAAQKSKSKRYLIFAVVMTLLASSVVIFMNRPSGDVAFGPDFVVNLKNASVERVTISHVSESCDVSGSCPQTAVGKIDGEFEEIAVSGYVDGVSPDDKVWVMSRGGESQNYTVIDVDNTLLIIALVLVMVAAVVAFAGRKGVIALLGVVASCISVVAYIVPVASSGQSIILPTVACGAITLAIIMFLTHGLKRSTAVAYMGTVVSLSLVGVSMYVLTDKFSYSNLSDSGIQEAMTLITSVNAAQLASAAVIIGSLGLFNDICVSQAATVRELVTHNPSASSKSVLAVSLRVGRDHVASIIYTITLVFLGVALPHVVVYANSGLSLEPLLLSGAFASEIIKSTVCIIVLCLSVPATTLIAVSLESTGSEDVKTVVHAH